MPAFLIEYHRPSGRVKCTPFDSLIGATRERIRLDRLNEDPDMELVAISGASENVIRHSHSRYFAAV